MCPYLEASNMSVKSGRGNHLPAWATDVPAARTLAAGMYRTLVERGAATALLRALLECANGVMPPSLVTDVSAAMFGAWAAAGDDMFAPLLLAALGGYLVFK